MRGERGIGKTALVDEIRARSAARGMLVLHCAPGEGDARLALTGLGDLLSNVAPMVVPHLPLPQRRALEVALLLADPTGPALDARALAVSVRAALGHLSQQQPVLVAIDDLRWLDLPSAHALEFALRRSVNDRLGVLVSTRLARGEPLPVDVERTLGGMSDVTLGPLSVGALFRLLRDRVGLELQRPQLLRLHAACGGNPLHALVIARELREGRLRLSPGEPVPLPDSLLALVDQRMRQLPARTREVLAAAASLSRPAVEVLESAFSPEVVDVAVERAASKGIAELEDGAIRFVHPLFASASYSAMPAHARRAIHRRLAAVVVDPEEQARQLALGSARRDEGAALALEAAAERAATRGAPGTAAELADLAIELTPRADHAHHVRRTLRAVELHATAGELPRSHALGTQLLSDLHPGAERAAATLAVAATLEGDLEQMTVLLDGALREPGVDDRLRAHLLAQLAEARFRRGHAREALAPARRGLELARQTGDTRIVLELVAHLATVEFWSGEVGPDLLLDEEGRGALHGWVQLERRSDLHLSFADSPRAALATRLVHLGAMDDARALFLEVLTDAKSRGDERSRARALWHLAQLEDYAGDWQRSEELMNEAIELEEQLGLESGAVSFARAGHAAVLGRVEETGKLVEEGVAHAREAGDVPYELLTLGVLGFLRFSLGDATRATEILCPVVERALQISEPRINRYWPDTIEALVAVGDLELAGQYLDLYSAEATRLGVPRSLARVAHCRGVLLAAKGEGEAAATAFDEALAIHGRCANVFEHARTRLPSGSHAAVLGSAGRRASRSRRRWRSSSGCPRPCGQVGLGPSSRGQGSGGGTATA